MDKLSELPNIGKTLEEKLIKTEITSQKQLIELGAEQAFIKLDCINEASCYNMLCAFEGAIQDIRWHQLAKERKDELKNFLKLKKI